MMPDQIDRSFAAQQCLESIGVIPCQEGIPCGYVTVCIVMTTIALVVMP